MKYRTNLPTFSSLWIAACVLVFPAILCGQSIVNPFHCNAADRLPPACQNRSYQIRFEVEPAGATVTGWQVLTSPGCADLNFDFPDPANPSLMRSPDVGSGSGNQIICVRAVINGHDTTQNFNINIDNCGHSVTATPCMWDIAFVLDRSGSMDTPEGATPTPTRWDKLVQIFDPSELDHISTMASVASLGLNDNWGLFFFGNDGVVHNAANHRGNFNQTMNLATWPAPLGNTPMGGGLQSALQNFFTPLGVGRGRAIILMTDGQQNKNPRVLVTAVPTGHEFRIFEDLSWHPFLFFPAGPAVLGNGSGLGALPIPQERFISNRIRLFSVSVGVNPAIGNELDDISEEYESTLNLGDLRTFFNTTLPDIFRGSSPRIINILRDTIPEMGAKAGEQSFVVNEEVKNLTLKFVASDGHEFSSANLEITLFKDGKSVAVNPRVQNSRMVLYDLDFPYTSNVVTLAAAAPIDADGTWTIRYQDIKPVPCDITIFADDEALKYNLDFQGNKDFYAGDDLPVSLSLNYLDTAVVGAKVIAVLVRPDQDVGDFVANIQLPNDTLGLNNPDLSQGQFKINYALTNPDFIQTLRQEERKEIQLTDQGDGTYTGVFTGNDVVGGYRVIVRLTGTLPNGDPYEGWDLESAFYDFARPDEIDLNEDLIEGKPNPDLQSYTLIVTPTNQFDRKIGPAQESRIYVKLSEGSVGAVKDNLDGSYSIPLSVPANSNPIVSVSVIDPNKPIIEKCLRCFNPPSWALSLHAGINLPFFSLDSLYDPGIYAELDLRYRFNQRFALELVGGYYGFRSDFHILGGSIFGDFTFPNVIPNGWDGHLAAGLGVFAPKNEDTTWGIGIRGSIAKQFNAHWEAGLDLSLFRLPDVSYQFGAVGLGVHYNF